MSFGLKALILSTILAFLVPLSAAATPFLRAVTRDGGLYVVDQDTGLATFESQIAGVTAVNELEIDPANGNAYISYSSTNLGPQYIQQIDLSTGAFVGSGVPIVGEFGALEFVGSTLYAAGPSPRSSVYSDLYVIDLVSGINTLIGSTNASRIGGMAYDAATGTMYASSNEGGGSFGTIDLATGAFTPISAQIFQRGLAAGPDDRIYGSGSALLVFDKTTGVATQIGSGGYPGPGFLGLAAIPEPSTALLMGLGLTMLAASRSRP